MPKSNGYLRYILNELLDEDEDGIPDQPQGIPRTPGMSLAAPSSDERLDDFIGIDQPELDMAPESEFETSPLDQFLERMSASGVPAGLARPRGLGQGLIAGIAQGAVGRGQRVGERRKKFEEAQTKRAALRDVANLQATRDAKRERGTAMRERIKEERETAKDRAKYERENPKPTPAQLEAMPWLGRVLDADGRVPRDYFAKEDPAFGAQKETRRRFENDRDYQLRVGAERRQAAKDAREGTGAGKAATEFQGKVQLMRTRAKEAADVAVANGLEGRMLKKAWSLAQPPELQGDPDTRKYWRAMESFTLALNRLESGANVTPTEFSRVRKLYFVTPGDKEADVRDKERMRATIIDELSKLQSAGAQKEQAAAGNAITPAQLWEP